MLSRRSARHVAGVFTFSFSVTLSHWGNPVKQAKFPSSGAATLFYYLTRCKPSALSRYTCVQTSSKYFRS